MKIGGTTKKIGILGWPVEHSFSPRLHNRAFAALNLNYVYLPLAVRPEDLAQAFAGLKALDFVGANVTIPHKIAIMPYLDELDETAQLVGAVNTLVLKDNRWIGYNTDATGFMASLRQAGVDLSPRPVLLLGAGGAARAVVAGLILAGFQEFYLAVRRPEQAEAFERHFPQAKFKTVAFGSVQFNQTAALAGLVINTTPLGMSPRIEEQPQLDYAVLQPQAVLCDLIYNPPKTRFLAEGEKLGHLTVSGQGMLVEQGLKAFELWTEQPAPRRLFYSEIQNIL